MFNHPMFENIRALFSTPAMHQKLADRDGVIEQQKALIESLRSRTNEPTFREVAHNFYLSDGMRDEIVSRLIEEYRPVLRDEVFRTIQTIGEHRPFGQPHTLYAQIAYDQSARAYEIHVTVPEYNTTLRIHSL